MADRILNKKEVIKLTTLSGPTLWRMCKRKTFPKRLQIGLGRVGWRESEVLAWMEDLKKVK